MGSQDSDLTGRTIGEYEIVARIGVGGMGVVYEGRQPLIGKRVAVKVLLPSLSGEKELVDRFLAEARAVNEVRHRGIVDIFSFGELPEGAHYFVMEFLEGEAFDRIVKKRAPLPLLDALTWAEEALDALGAAHRAGIIHRDIKPSNLFLVDTGRERPYVKLLDFGIAKLGATPGEATPQTRASVILGTPDYISPEQARGKAISPQTDLYAMGCVLFEMLTGTRLFKGDNTLATMWSHVEDEPPLPSSLRPEIPQALDAIILWALEKDPNSRPPDAAAMRAALEQVRVTLASTSPPSNPGLSLTPPPSVLQRATGTPLPSRPGHPTLGTPSPRSSGGQPSLRTRRPSPPAETKAAPLPGDDLPTRITESEMPAQRSRLPLVLAGLAFVVLVGAAVLLFVPSGRGAQGTTTSEPARLVPQTPPVAASPPAEPPPVETPPKTPQAPPTAETTTPPAPEVESPRPPETPKADVPKVARPSGPTQRQLQARLAALERRLADREAATGERDRVLRQFLEQAHKDVARATTEAKRREVGRFIDEIQGQFGP